MTDLERERSDLHKAEADIAAGERRLSEQRIRIAKDQD